MSDEHEPVRESSGGWLQGHGHPSALSSAHPTRRRHRGRLTLVGGVLGGIALLTLLLAFGLGRDPSVVRSALIGRAAPSFDLPFLESAGHLRLSDLRGQVVVVNFWGSWCQGCRLEHNALEATWQRYRDQGVLVVGVSFQDAVASSRAFAHELKMDWPLVIDSGSRTALSYGVYGAPETFFIDRNGTVRDRWIGPITYERLTDEITRLQGEGR
jgi:cytochrome c biogenesis protein CcmG/thiol:disulfide interchange protein DsbE